jgi:hypothetical protein
MSARAAKTSDAFASTHNLFHSTGWYLFRNLTIALALFFWLASAYWVLRDARRRIADPWIVAMAALFGLVPIVGPLLWLLVRPLEPVADARIRELEARALKQRVRGGEFCPGCGSECESSFRYCPVCAKELKTPCRECDVPLEPLWQNCPYCGTSVVTVPEEVLPMPAFPDLLRAATGEPEPAHETSAS